MLNHEAVLSDNILKQKPMGFKVDHVRPVTITDLAYQIINM